jgi:putative ABC transport system permease protein
MRRYFSIILTGLKMAVEEFRSNKLRTFLSLFGVTIGIFCIISVLSTVGSLERAIENDIKSLGSNTVYIDKWVYGGSDEYPWWKYVNRPEPKFTEVKLVRDKVPIAAHVAFNTEISDAVEYGSTLVKGVSYYGVSDEFFFIEPIEVSAGRLFQQRDYDLSTNSILIGYDVAEQLFGNPALAVGKLIRMKNQKIGVVIGLIKKQGKSMIQIYNFDNCVMMVNSFMTQLNPERWSQPKLIVQGRADIPIPMLMDELEGTMRSLRKLSPSEENNFALNNIDELSKFTSEIFANVNIGGWSIAALSLVVGKKALGAKSSTILIEFLLESAFLCIIGGMIGLLLVFVLTKILSAALGFPLFISMNIMFLAIGICIVVGILAGIIPASIAARMNPVVAIRSN